MDKREKAQALYNAVLNGVHAITSIASQPIPNARLLRKMPLGKSRLPHVKKRQLKQQAQSELNAKTIQLALSAISTSAQLHIINSTPLPNYPKGGITN